VTVRTVELQGRPRAVPLCWQRSRNALVPPQEPRVPEPAQLYTLVVLALAVHANHPTSGLCDSCAQAWPCDTARLAYRLREGF
jgi:hypothetical protein